MPEEEGEELYRLLNACRQGNSRSQDQLYRRYYRLAMGVCLRYSHSHEEAVEMLNDGFVKIFTKLDRYTPGLSFKGWLRKVMVHAAIDYYRRNEKYAHNVDLSFARHVSEDPTALDQLSAQEILQAVQQLPPSYRMVFNLFVMEGYKHEEIAQQLTISVGTSKSNLSIARIKLQKMLTSRKAIRFEEKHDG